MLAGRRSTRNRRRGVPAVQEALFDVEVQPERRFYRQILEALSRSGFGEDALDAELVVSRLFGTVWAGQEGARDGGTEEAFGLALVDYARQRRLPVSVAVLRVVSRVAPIREVRAAATEVAGLLVAEGLPEPRWSPPLAALRPGRCWAYEDAFGDESTIIAEFEYRPGLDVGPRHALLAYVDHAHHSVATDAMFTNDVDAMIRDLRNEGHPAAVFTLRQVDPAWARALGERAVARTDLIEAVRTEPTFAELRALLMARLAALPDDPGSLPPEPPPPTPAQTETVVADFLTSEQARDLPAAPETATVARRIIAHAGEHDPGRLLRVSPAKWESFAFAELRPGELSAAVADVIRAWSRWASRPLPDSARTELAAALDEILTEAAVNGSITR